VEGWTPRDFCKGQRDWSQVWWPIPVFLGTLEAETGSWFQANVSKNLERLYLNYKKLGVVVYTCHPSYVEGVHKNIMVQASPGKNLRPYLKVKQKGLGE
jgi:hypothetical protein